VGDGEGRHWDSRGHVFAAAAEAMRRILVESARRKKRLRHGGGRRRADLDEASLAAAPEADHLLAIDEALTSLAAEDPEAAELVKLRFYAGLSVEEAGAARGLSRTAACRQWAYARAWLRCAVEGSSRAAINWLSSTLPPEPYRAP
jgi:RNA polymerase sigma factor (TIGR02999 family)